MPVSLCEWRVRIGRFIQQPPVIDKQKLLKSFKERWEARKKKKKKTEETSQDSQSSAPDSARKENEVSVCSFLSKLVSSCVRTASSLVSSLVRVISTPVRLFWDSYNWCQERCLFWIFKRDERAKMSPGSLRKQHSVPRTPRFMSTGLAWCQARASYATGGFCHLYLPAILLMRAGDIETNPGPNDQQSLENTIVHKEEFLELANRIDGSYYIDIGIHLGFEHAVLNNMKEKHHCVKDALMDIFMKWKYRQPAGTNIRASLAECLKKSNLHDLADKLTSCFIDIRDNTSTSGSVKPPSLTEDQIKMCAKDLKTLYKSTLCKIQLDPLDPTNLVRLEDIYTNLVLEEERGSKRTEITYDNLLNPRKDKEPPHRLLVQGEAGAGKTTLCAKIAWDWINGTCYQQFDLVLVVPLREAEKCSVGEIAKSYLAKSNPVEACQLNEYIRSNPESVFIVLDGLDELKVNISNQSSDTSQLSHAPPTSGQAVLKGTCRISKSREDQLQEGDLGIGEILHWRGARTTPVLVTTRPWKADHIRRDNHLCKVYTFIRVEGFSKENLSTYIHKYFLDENKKAGELTQFMEDSDIISENMAPYPIYTAMLCLMWRELNEEKREKIKSLQTYSQIFMALFNFLKDNYISKICKNVDGHVAKGQLEKINNLLKPISELAFQGLLEDNLIFSEDCFSECEESMETACRVGILSQENRLRPMLRVRAEMHDSSKPRITSTVFFPHKLFQEYMAGVYLASLHSADHPKFVRFMDIHVLPNYEKFRYLLYFTGAQNRDVGIDIVTLMVNYKRPEEDFIVDVLFEIHNRDASRELTSKLLQNMNSFQVDEKRTAHTVAGYLFLPLNLTSLRIIEKECGRTLSCDLAEAICLMPSLREVFILNSNSHDIFFRILSERGKDSQVS